jgi:hypothetical protein
MQINNNAPSNITEAAPAAGVAVAPPPVKPAAAPKPAAKAVAPVADTKKVDAAAAGTAGTKTEITDVEPTGEANAEGDPTFTLKVNGKEYKATQSEIIALAQKAKGAEAAMKKAAELEKLSTNLIENMDSDLHGLLVRRYGKEKADQMVIAMTRKLIDDEAKDPKDRELERLRAENETHKQAQERVKQEQEAAEKKVKQTQLYRQILTEIDTELNATHLPKDKLTLTRVLNYLAAGKKSNGATWTIKDAVQAVAVEDMSHATHYAKRYVDGLLPSDQFRKIFGDDAVKKLNKEQIQTLKNADKIAKHEQPKLEAASNGNGEAPVRRAARSLSKGKGTEGMSEREWRRQHGSLGGI